MRRDPEATPTPSHAILRPAQPYDLATPGTPTGILAVARAAEQGASLRPPGGWRHRATFALAASNDAESAVVASLVLRLVGDLPGRPRRAWVAYVRRTDAAGTVRWVPNGAALLDNGDVERPMRVIGVEELKAILRGEEWTPPAPRPPALTVPCPTCGGPLRITNAGVPYANHRCTPTKTTEGRS